MKDFRTLHVWQKAHRATLSIYRATKAFPRREQYGLTSQIRRAAFSIPSNIAEGCGRGSDADFARFLQIALGSASELEYQILLARDLELLDEPRYERLSDQVVEIKRMTTGLLKRLHADR